MAEKQAKSINISRRQADSKPAKKKKKKGYKEEKRKKRRKRLDVIKNMTLCKAA